MGKFVILLLSMLLALNSSGYVANLYAHEPPASPSPAPPPSPRPSPPGSPAALDTKGPAPPLDLEGIITEGAIRQKAINLNLSVIRNQAQQQRDQTQQQRDQTQADYDNKDRDLKFQLGLINNKLNRLSGPSAPQWQGLMDQLQSKQKEINLNYQQYRSKMNAINAKQKTDEGNAYKGTDTAVDIGK